MSSQEDFDASPRVLPLNQTSEIQPYMFEPLAKAASQHDDLQSDHSSELTGGPKSISTGSSQQDSQFVTDATAADNNDEQSPPGPRFTRSPDCEPEW